MPINKYYNYQISYSNKNFKIEKFILCFFFFLVLLCLSTSIYLKTKKRENLIRFQFGFQFLSNFVSHIPSNFFFFFLGIK